MYYQISQASKDRLCYYEELYVKVTHMVLIREVYLAGMDFSTDGKEFDSVPFKDKKLLNRRSLK